MFSLLCEWPCYTPWPRQTDEILCWLIYTRLVNLGGERMHAGWCMASTCAWSYIFVTIYFRASNFNGYVGMLWVDYISLSHFEMIHMEDKMIWNWFSFILWILGLMLLTLERWNGKNHVWEDQKTRSHVVHSFMSLIRKCIRFPLLLTLCSNII